MKRKAQKIEYQYFIMENEKIKDRLEFKIGPTPIPMRDIDNLVKKAFKDQGKKYGTGKDWIIKKAWTE